MAYSFIASTSKGVADGGHGPTDPIDTTGADLIVIGVQQSSFITFNIPAPTDNKGNTYTAIDQSSNVQGASTALFYCINPTVGSGHTFNVTGLDLCAVLTPLAFSGVAADVFPHDSKNTGTGASIQPGSLMPGTSDQLFVTTLCLAAATYAGLGQTDTASIDSDFTKAEQVVSTGDWLHMPDAWMNGAIAYKIQSGQSAENPTWSWPTTLTQAAVILATFSPEEVEEEEPPPPPEIGSAGPHAWMEWPRVEP